MRMVSRPNVYPMTQVVTTHNALDYLATKEETDG